MTVHHDLPWTQNTVIATACVVESLCSLQIAFSAWLAGRRRLVPGLLWLCGYVVSLACARLLTAAALCSRYPLWSALAVWHTVTVLLGLSATVHFARLLGGREADVHLDRALQTAIAALGAQELVDTIPFPAAVLAPDGGIQAINEALADLLGCRLRDLEGFRWSRWLAGRERTRMVTNWMDFSQGRIEHFYEESLWTRPGDRKPIHLATRGTAVGTQIVVGVADVTHIPPNGGSL